MQHFYTHSKRRGSLIPKDIQYKKSATSYYNWLPAVLQHAAPANAKQLGSQEPSAQQQAIPSVSSAQQPPQASSVQNSSRGSVQPSQTTQPLTNQQPPTLAYLAVRRYNSREPAVDRPCCPG